MKQYGTVPEEDLHGCLLMSPYAPCCWQSATGLVEVFATIVCLVQETLLIVSLLIAVWFLAPQNKLVVWIHRKFMVANSELKISLTHPAEIVEDYYNITMVPDTKTAQASLWPVPSLKLA